MEALVLAAAAAAARSGVGAHDSMSAEGPMCLANIRHLEISIRVLSCCRDTSQACSVRTCLRVYVGRVGIKDERDSEIFQ